MKTSLEIYGEYGFHRYRKNISRVETDYLDENETVWNNKILREYRGYTIYIEWLRVKEIKSVVFLDGKYIAEYAKVYEDKMEIYRRTEKYINYLIDKGL